MGLRRGEHFEIVSATYPETNDVSTPNSFSRLDKRHALKIHSIWEENKGLVTLIGDWHSHPIGDGTPSSKDRRAWRALLDNGLTDCIGIILGSTDLPRFIHASHGRFGMKILEWSIIAHDEADLVLSL